MNLSILAKGTKLKLSKDWSPIFHEERPSIYANGIRYEHIVLKKGSVLSLHDIDIRGNCKVPKCVKFLIPKKGCPHNPEYEGQAFFVHLNNVSDLEFELNSKADRVLNDFEEALKIIKEEIKTK